MPLPPVSGNLCVTQQAFLSLDRVSSSGNFIRDHLPPGASGQVRTACGRFGLIAAAGEMATEFGLSGWSEGKATMAALKCFQAWLNKRGSIGDHDIEASIRQVTGYLSEYG